MPWRLVAAVSALALLASGCVTRGNYDQVVSERDRLKRDKAQLERRVERLDASTQSLDNERTSLISEVEELADERDRLRLEGGKLQSEVERLHDAEQTLGSELADVNEEVAALQTTYQDLVGDLEQELARGEIEIEQLRSGLRVAVSDEILFRSGSAVVGREGREVLTTVAGRLAESQYDIEVVGHTDDIPITGLLTQKFPTNWELAGARAAQVVRLFLESGVTGDRLRASSRAEYEPVAGNDTDEGRSLNRRIEIRLRPREAGPVSEQPANES